MNTPNQKAVTASSIEDLIGKQVGSVRIYQPITQKHNCEYAAWFTMAISATGDFPVFLRRDPFNPHHIYFSAELPATVDHDYYAAHHGGVAVTAYDGQQNHGKPTRPVVITKDFVTGITQTTNSDEETEPKWAIFHETWQAFKDYAHSQIRHYTEYFRKCAADYEAQPESKYMSEVSAISHAGERVSHFGEAAREIDFQISHFSEQYYYGNNRHIEQPVKSAA